MTLDRCVSSQLNITQTSNCQCISSKPTRPVSISHIATDSCGISFPLVHTYRKTLYSDDHVRVVFRIRASHISWHFTYAKFHLTTSDKKFEKYSRRHVLHSTLLVKSTVLRISNVFLIRKNILQIYGVRYFLAIVNISWHQNNLPSQTKYRVFKMNSTYHEADKSATWYRVFPSFTQIKMTMRASVLAQQFTHASDVHPNPSPRFSYLLENCRQDRKIQENTRTKSKQSTRQDIPLDRKVSVSLSTFGIKLLVLLGSPCRHPLLLSLLRWSRKLLASSGLF